MTRMVDPTRTHAFVRAYGDELRQARKRRGWTRKDLHRRLGLDISLQTLATYELGTRSCTVARLQELTEALEVSILEVLSRALQRVGVAGPVVGIYIDLIVAARLRRPELEPLRRWAQSRLRNTRDGEPTVFQLDLTALQRLAELCRIDTVELMRHLNKSGVGMTYSTPPNVGQPRS